LALTEFQREVARLIAGNRIASGESYMAGGATLNALIDAPRVSQDIDLFHDSHSAVHTCWHRDRKTLENAGLKVALELEGESFVEASVVHDNAGTRLQWALDSAFRFFPLQAHPDFGLSLHPFDLATNKVLALVGRAEPRDWIDIIECDRRLQPLGYLVWAAAGKDPGLNPMFILEHAARSARYTEVELSVLTFEGERPTAASLSQQWKAIMQRAREVVDELPAPEVGKCVHFRTGDLVRLDVDELEEALDSGFVRFHEGRLLGAYPVLVDT